MTTRSLLICLGLAACGTDPVELQLAELKAQAAGNDATRVEVVSVQPTQAVLTLSLPGEVVGSEDALLASALGGIVDSVRVDEGEDVRRGQLLVSIDSEIYEAQVQQSEAQLAQAEADLKRLEALGDMATEAELSGLTTQVAVSRANLRIARSQLGRARITAPFAGTVGMLDIEVGEMAQPGAPLIRLVKLDPVEVNLSVSDRDVVALERGVEARVTANAVSGIRMGEILDIAPVADLRTRTFLVRARVANPKRDLLPGMIANVDVERVVQEGAIVLPQDWVVTRRDGYGVFVVQDGTASWRDVELGQIVRGQIVVTSGVDPGDRVVIVGQHDLVDGDEVLISREGVCCEDGRPVYASSTAAR